MAEAGPEPSTQEPAGPMAPPGPRPEEGLLETVVSVVTEPVPTLRRLTRERPIGWALAVAAVISLLSTLVAAAQPVRGQPGLGADVPPLLGGGAPGLVLVGAAILGPILGIVSVAVWAGILQLMALLLGGKGPYSGLFVGVAFAGVPQVLGVPFGILPIALGPAWSALSFLVSLVLGLWALALNVIAVRENNGFTTARAAVAVLVPLAVLFFLAMAAVVALVVLALVALGGL